MLATGFYLVYETDYQTFIDNSFTFALQENNSPVYAHKFNEIQIFARSISE